ncbi:tRNA lysidine(34) synthetase TilS [Legionella septentrionalis]|nr:tRNA lysidine(34) synthetase TilS [Legionella septentrionalis]
MNCWSSAIKNLWRWELVTNTLLTDAWLARLAEYRRLFVGFSGGLDSTVLLHHVAMQPLLHQKVCAVHVHHGLSVYADDWENHCRKICNSFHIPLTVHRVNLKASSNVEELARVARYKFFSTLINDEEALLLGHHQNDQAETLLLQLLRGAGVDGLAAMQFITSFGKGVLLRPFLNDARAALEVYAAAQQLVWIEDESNENPMFSRNYLRHKVMPLIQARWPNAVSNLARSAYHCQQAGKNLQALAYLDCPELQENSNSLSLTSLQALSDARLINVLRVWLKNNRVRLPSTHMFQRLLHEVIRAKEDAKPCLHWGEIKIGRYRHTLFLQKAVLAELVEMGWTNFPETHFLSDQTRYLAAIPVADGLQVPAGSLVEIRFRRGGEEIRWHGQTKQLKKLWQQWRVPAWQRAQIPLLYINNVLAAVVGYAVSDLFYGKQSAYRVELHTLNLSANED